MLQLLDLLLVARGGLYLSVIFRFHIVDFYLLESAEGRTDAAKDGVGQRLDGLKRLFHKFFRIHLIHFLEEFLQVVDIIIYTGELLTDVVTLQGLQFTTSFFFDIL